MVTCLDCTGEIEHYDAGLYWCPRCRIFYPAELLADIDPDVWRRIQQGRLFCYRCDQALPGLPRVHVRRRHWWQFWRRTGMGDPIACPQHGPAPVSRSPST